MQHPHTTIFLEEYPDFIPQELLKLHPESSPLPKNYPEICRNIFHQMSPLSSDRRFQVFQLQIVGICEKS